MYKSGFAYGMNIQPPSLVWVLVSNRAVIQFIYTQTLDSLLVHMHETATDSCARSCRQVSSYISYRPCDLAWLCNHSPMTKMLSLEGVTLIYFSPDKINVIPAWLCRCHMKSMSQGPNNWLRSPICIICTVCLCKLQLYRLPTTQNLRNLSVARCTHMQTNMRLHKGTQNMKPFAAGVRF